MATENMEQSTIRCYFELSLSLIFKVSPTFNSCKILRGLYNALLVANIGSLLSLDELRFSITLRVGADICRGLRCSCSRPVNLTGLLGLSCHLNVGHFTHHTGLNLTIKQPLTRINVLSVLELSRLSRIDEKILDGLALCPWLMGRCLIWNATICNSFVPSHILDAAV